MCYFECPASFDNKAGTVNLSFMFSVLDGHLSCGCGATYEIYLDLMFILYPSFVRSPAGCLSRLFSVEKLVVLQNKFYYTLPFNSLADLVAYQIALGFILYLFNRD